LLSGKRITARIKPQNQRLEIHVPVDTRPEVCNLQKSKELGAARADDDGEKNQNRKEKREDEELRLSETRLKSEEITHKGVPVFGIVRDGKLYLHPISQTHQFRPTLTYLDILSRKNKRNRGADSDSDSDDGPPPDPDEIAPAVPLKKEKKAAGEAKEVHVSARKSDDQSGLGAQGSLSAVRREMLHIIRLEEEEQWENLAFCNVTSTQSSDVFESLFSGDDQVLECRTNMATFLKDIKGL